MILEGNRICCFPGSYQLWPVFIPGLNKLIILCHITIWDVKDALEVLSRSHEFFDFRPSLFSDI